MSLIIYFYIITSNKLFLGHSIVHMSICTYKCMYLILHIPKLGYAYIYIYLESLHEFCSTTAYNTIIFSLLPQIWHCKFQLQ